MHMLKHIPPPPPPVEAAVVMPQRIFDTMVKLSAALFPNSPESQEDAIQGLTSVYQMGYLAGQVSIHEQQAAHIDRLLGLVNGRRA
jgi:kynurenine formamidase